MPDHDDSLGGETLGGDDIRDSEPEHSRREGELDCFPYGR